MESLLRTQAAGFQLQDSCKISKIEEEVRLIRSQDPHKELTREDFKELVRSTDSVFLQYPKVCVRAEYSKLLYNGNPLQKECILGWQESYEKGALRIYDQKQAFVGIYQWEEDVGYIRPIKIFME